MCGANLLEIQFLCINSVALLGLPGFRTFSKIWFFTDFHSITCLGLMEMGLLSWATLFRYSRSLQRPLLEYQKLASHHPRRFADWISAFLNLLRHGHFREDTKSCMWGTRPVSFHFTWRAKIFEIQGCGAQCVEPICVKFTLNNYVDLLGLLGFRPFSSF